MARPSTRAAPDPRARGAARLVGFNLGVVLLAIGWPTGDAGLAAAGLGLVAVVVFASVALAVIALRDNSTAVTDLAGS